MVSEKFNSDFAKIFGGLSSGPKPPTEIPHGQVFVDLASGPDKQVTRFRCAKHNTWHTGDEILPECDLDGAQARSWLEGA